MFVYSVCQGVFLRWGNSFWVREYYAGKRDWKQLFYPIQSNILPAFPLFI